MSAPDEIFSTFFADISESRHPMHVQQYHANIWIQEKQEHICAFLERVALKGGRWCDISNMNVS